MLKDAYLGLKNNRILKLFWSHKGSVPLLAAERKSAFNDGILLGFLSRNMTPDMTK